MLDFSSDELMKLFVEVVSPDNSKILRHKNNDKNNLRQSDYCNSMLYSIYNTYIIFRRVDFIVGNVQQKNSIRRKVLRSE